MTRLILEAKELTCQVMRCTHLLRNHANFALVKLTSSVPHKLEKRSKPRLLRRWPGRPAERERQSSGLLSRYAFE